MRYSSLILTITLASLLAIGTCGLAAAQNGTGIAVFHQGYGEDGWLWVTEYNPQTGTWTQDGHVVQPGGGFVGMSASPSAVVSGGNIDLFHQGRSEDECLWWSVFDGQSGTWSADTQVPYLNSIFNCPEPIFDSPSAIIGPNGISVLFQYPNFPFQPIDGGSGQLANTYENGNSPNSWSLQGIPNVGMTASPSTVLGANGYVYVFHQGSSEDGQLWYTYFDGTNWQPDTQVLGTDANGKPTNIGMSQSPSAVLYGGTFYVFHQGYGQNGQLWYSYFDGTNWQPDTQVLSTDANGFTTNVGMSESPSAIVY